jgi:hypothetical protein
VNLFWNDTRNDLAHLSTHIFYARSTKWRPVLRQERAGRYRAHQRDLLRRLAARPVRGLRGHRRHGWLSPPHLDRPAGRDGVPR